MHFSGRFVRCKCNRVETQKMTVTLYICALISNLLKNSMEFTLLISPLQLKQPFLKTLLNCFIFDSLCSKGKYSKALRCTFFGERKKSCSSKFVQHLLLNRMKARWLKNRAAQGFHYINSFISNFFGPNSKTCTCEVRAAWGRVSQGLTVVQFFREYDFLGAQFVLVQ